MRARPTSEATPPTRPGARTTPVPEPTALTPTAERLSRIAALALAFDHGTILLPDDRSTSPLGPRPSAAADLDRRVLTSGEALVLERADAELAPLGAYAGVPVSCQDQVVSVLSVCDEL